MTGKQVKTADCMPGSWKNTNAKRLDKVLEKDIQKQGYRRIGKLIAEEARSNDKEDLATNICHNKEATKGNLPLGTNDNFRQGTFQSQRDIVA